MKEGLRAPIFNGTNYKAWSLSMKFMLNGEDLWEVVFGTESVQRPPAVATHASFSSFSSSTAIDISAERKKQKKAAMLIFQFYTFAIQSFIAHEEDLAKQWRILKEYYGESGSISTGQNLLEEFYHEKFVNFNSIDEYGWIKTQVI